jgi:hypothetical protein
MAIEDAVPGVAPAKLIAAAVGGLLFVAFLIWAGWKLFFADGQAQRAHDQAQIHGQAVVNKAQGDAGAAASNIVAGAAQKETIIHETTRDHYVEITKQPGAGDPVNDAVWDAFVRSVCVRASASGEPDCQRLSQAGP